MTDNGSAGIGIYDPTPGTKAYDNTVVGNVSADNGNASIMMHAHAPDQNLSGNQLIGNSIGLNNALGDSDSGDMQTTGILVWASVSHVSRMPIRNNVVVGGNHSGIWVGGLSRPR